MNLFNFLKSQLPILNIVSEYTTLKPAGIYFKGVCPFHSEKTPSFTVSPHKDIFYCFGCHISGDVISFIAKIENCSQIEAAKFLIERFNLKIPTEIDKEFSVSLKSIDDKKKYYVLCHKFALWCHDNLNKSLIAKKYLQKRGFNKDIINKYLIGFFPSGQSEIKNLLKSLNNEGFLAKDLLEANILMEGKINLYSPFEDRIIFPIKDAMSKFCGFGGRVFKENDERVKYYNSHENQYFNKGSLLFGLDLAKKTIQETGQAFIVEGYTDCLIMNQNGFSNTIATLGTACTLEHLKILSRFAQRIIVIYDGDLAGQKAVLRLTELCWNVNLELKVVCLQENEDPASFLNKNGDLKALINSAKDIYTYFIEASGKIFSNKTLSEKISTVRKLTDIIRNIEDPLKRDILLQEVANKLNIPIESLRKENIQTTSFIKLKQEDNIETENEIVNISNLEKNIFTAILNDFNLLTNEYHYLIDYFSSPIKDILKKIIDLKNKNKNFKFDDFQTYSENSETQFINKILMEQQEDLKNNFKQLIIQFQKKNWKNISINIKRQLNLAQQNADSEAVLKIINNFQNLKKKLISGGLNE